MDANALSDIWATTNDLNKVALVIGGLCQAEVNQIFAQWNIGQITGALSNALNSLGAAKVASILFGTPGWSTIVGVLGRFNQSQINQVFGQWNIGQITGALSNALTLPHGVTRLGGGKSVRLASRTPRPPGRSRV
jgi:hypothetical protein